MCYSVMEIKKGENLQMILKEHLSQPKRQEELKAAFTEAWGLEVSELQFIELINNKLVVEFMMSSPINGETFRAYMVVIYNKLAPNGRQFTFINVTQEEKAEIDKILGKKKK